LATTTELATWRSEALAHLLAARQEDGGWGYHADTPSVSEATALAVLALTASGDESEAGSAGAAWLSEHQRSDGFLSATQLLTERSWMTSIGGLALHEAGLSAAAGAARDALLGAGVFTLAIPRPAVYGYNTGLPGWPWTDGDFSFIEPTALAVLFLKKMGQTNHARVREGVNVLRDRALDAGGWNYGEPEVLQGDLFPTIIPTAIALLALRDEQDSATEAGLAFLESQQGSISTLLSLGWATIALNVHSRLTDAWCGDAVNLWSDLPEKRRDPVGTALCLLGVSESSPHPMSL
jgi:hypothetical protein